MPTKHTIINGSSVLEFVFESHALNGRREYVEITCTNWPSEAEDDRGNKIIVLHVGKCSGEFKSNDPERKREKWLYTFIGKSPFGSMRNEQGPKQFPFYVVGHYNTRTREGKCKCYDQWEFSKDPIMRVLFGEE
ncbi:MAG: hypothetical protein WCP15_04310 [bacterium]